MLQTLIGHGHRVRSVSFLNDDKLIASGSDDRTIRVWDNAISKVMKTLEGHYSKAPLVSFSSEHTPTGYGINSDGSWITFWDGWERRNLLYLPPEFRPSSSATSDSTPAIGCPSGRVLIFYI